MQENIQMVDDDEIENVGIMSGFMDDLEELMSEIDAEEMEGEDADMAAMMGRTPDSPEILMNNLRGDMRSIDARREELADLVGAREAEETPEGVLALLQPVLAQQQAAQPMPMAPPMPPQGMPPEMMGMPPQGMPPMPPQGGPPQGMPPQGMGIEAVMPPMPGMYRGGPVQNFNQGSGAMGVTPSNDAFSAYPSDVVQEAQRRVRHMVDGGMVQNYNRGGAVQHFEKGSTPEAVSPVTAPPIDIEAILAAYAQSSPEAVPASQVPTLEEGIEKYNPLYETLLGSGKTSDASRNQMLLDIGQAAFQYGSNVGPDGRPMQGSGAARLSQSLAPLAGKFSARSAATDKEGQAIKMLALQTAQTERTAAQEAEVDRRALEAAALRDRITPITAAERVKFDLPTGTPTGDMPWMIKNGAPYLPSGIPEMPAQEDALLGKWGDKIVQTLSTVQDESRKGTGLVPRINSLIELSKVMGTGRANELVVRAFPGQKGNAPELAFENIVSQVLPQMRAPGSGAQSDKDIEVLRLGFGDMRQSDEVRRLTLETLLAKAALDQKRLDVINLIGNGEGQITIMEANSRVNDLASQTVFSPELESLLFGILGIADTSGLIIPDLTTRTDAETLAALPAEE